jgi:hypothetical protein
MTSGNEVETVRLDLNNPVFQRTLFNLMKNEQRTILNTLKKIAAMTWQQVYSDRGLKWEAILSRKGPNGSRIYTFRLGKGFRAIGYRDQSWLRILSVHPDHDSAYK